MSCIGTCKTRVLQSRLVYQSSIETRTAPITPDMRKILDVDHVKFKTFRENFIFANIVIRHICDVKNWRLWHDLPRSVNDSVISPFHEGFIFAKLCSREVS